MESALRERVVLLDGGFATRLEARGHDLSDTLWSARLLLDDPDEIRATHADFFAAGAEVAITASYQVSETGFRAAGRSAGDAHEALRRSVRLAREAAGEFAGERWVAASVGPYGASLADGSEYRGDYGLSVDELRAWHRPRLAVLAEAGADLLACETIPCLAEVEADEVTAILAAANLGHDVLLGDATAVLDKVPPDAAVFCDPARRTSEGRSWRVEDLSPPWSFVGEVLRTRTACIKLAPGLPHALIPDGVAATWVSERGDLVELSLWLSLIHI